MVNRRLLFSCVSTLRLPRLFRGIFPRSAALPLGRRLVITVEPKDVLTVWRVLPLLIRSRPPGTTYAHAWPIHWRWLLLLLLLLLLWHTRMELTLAGSRSHWERWSTAWPIHSLLLLHMRWLWSMLVHTVRMSHLWLLLMLLEIIRLLVERVAKLRTHMSTRHH